MTAWLIKVFGLNWRTNLAAAIAFLISVPSLITAITDWAHHQPADWRGAILGVVLAAGVALSKDAATFTTTDQAAAAQAKVEGDPRANAQMKAATDDVKNALVAPKPDEDKKP